MNNISINLCLLLFIALIQISCKPNRENNILRMITKSPNDTRIEIIGQSTSDTTFLFLHENGLVKKQYQRNSQGLQGLLLAYFENGLVYRSEAYNNDTLNGEALNYYDNGTLKDKMIYEKGELIRHTQYNRDGTRRGMVMYYQDETYFDRYWTYNSNRMIDSVITLVCPVIELREHPRSIDTLILAFNLPLNNSEFNNSEFVYRYTIEIYTQDSLKDIIRSSDVRFTDGVFLDTINIRGIDSLDVSGRVSLNEITYDPCAKLVKMEW